MAQATLVPPNRVADAESFSRPAVTPATRAEATFRFESLVLTEPTAIRKGRSATLAVSIVLHAILLVAVVVVPLLYYDSLPAPDEAVRAFFVTPAVAAPPPPPPPAAGVRPAPRTPVVPQPEEPAKFVAPLETPAEIEPEEGIALGVEGGVPGGVEGGVPGGVVGGIVGGLPQEGPPPAAKLVRVGGQIKTPKLLKRVDPVYPDLAKQARAGALIILEATVDVTGRVQEVRILRSPPLFDEPAVEALKQWTYRPLLLNGVPTPFIVTVTFNFHFQFTAPVS